MLLLLLPLLLLLLLLLLSAAHHTFNHWIFLHFITVAYGRTRVADILRLWLSTERRRKVWSLPWVSRKCMSAQKLQYSAVQVLLTRSGWRAKEQSQSHSQSFVS